MDGTYYRFTEIMELVMAHPNDMELGQKVREYYWNHWRKENKNTNKFKLEFPEDEPIIDADIDSIARRAED